MRSDAGGAARGYSYISPSGLETLLPQASALHRRLLQRRIKAAAPGKAGAGFPAADLARAEVLGDYLVRRRDWVGPVGGPGPYVRDTARLRYGVLRDYVAEVAVFAGVVDGVNVALIGAPEGLGDSAWEPRTDHGIDYYFLQHLRQDADRGRTDSRQWPGFTYEAAVEATLRPGVLPADGARMEFLAKPLFHSAGALLATPLFVARSAC